MQQSSTTILLIDRKMRQVANYRSIKLWIFPNILTILFLYQGCAGSQSEIKPWEEELAEERGNFVGN